MTLERAVLLTDIKNIFVVTAKDIYFHTEIQSKEINLEIPKDNYILQPMMKETLPIISLATKKI
jgi:mannose-1-phosphate guanylyltransferase